MSHSGSICNIHFCDIGLLMFPASLKASSLSRLLGHWRGDGKSEADYRLLARALQLLIMDGRVGLGVRLPGERELAQEPGVRRTTLTAAYGQLRENEIGRAAWRGRECTYVWNTVEG